MLAVHYVLCMPLCTFTTVFLCLSRMETKKLVKAGRDLLLNTLEIKPRLIITIIIFNLFCFVGKSLYSCFTVPYINHKIEHKILLRENETRRTKDNNLCCKLRPKRICSWMNSQQNISNFNIDLTKEHTKTCSRSESR